MKISSTAQRIYNDAIVVDGQLAFEVDMPWSFEEKWRLIDNHAQQGFTAVTLSLANEETLPAKALAYLARMRKHIFSHPEKYILATNAQDILRAKAENKIALRLMFQGVGPIGKNLDLLEAYQAMGISSLLLAYNIRTPLGDGVIETVDNGLSLLGKKFVAEMNKLKMTIDVAHAGYQTTLEALQITTAPIVASHSGAYAIHPHVRNVRDEQIIAIAKTGGVVGINGLGLLLGDDNASVEKYVEHVEHVIQLVGADHVAIGLDNLYFPEQFAEFMQSQAITHPTAYADQVGDATTWQYIKPAQMLEIVELLLQRGHNESAIRGFLGENILRVIG